MLPMHGLAVPLLSEVRTHAHDDSPLSTPTATATPSTIGPSMPIRSPGAGELPRMGGRMSATALAPGAMYGSGMRRLLSEVPTNSDCPRQLSRNNDSTTDIINYGSERDNNGIRRSEGDNNGITKSDREINGITKSDRETNGVPHKDSLDSYTPVPGPLYRRAFRRQTSSLSKNSRGLPGSNSESDLQIRPPPYRRRKIQRSLTLVFTGGHQLGRRFAFRCWDKWTKWIIDPSKSTRLEGWDLLVLATLFFTAIEVPYECAFMNHSWRAANYVVSVLFAMDTALQFFIAYPDPNHPTCFVRSPWGIVRKYLRFWFWIDIVSLVPLTAWGRMMRVQEQDLGGWRLIRLTRLLRLLRLTHLKRLLRRWNTSIGLSYAGISLCKFIGFTILWCHWMACIFGVLARQPPNQVTWLTGVIKGKQATDDTYGTQFDVYCIALYWAIATFTSIGYGDVVPQTTHEYIICSSMMALSAAAWAFIIGKVCTLMSAITAHDHKFRQNMDNLNLFMKERNVPQPLRSELRRYLFESVHMRRLEDQSAVLDQLSPMLQGEIAVHLHKPWIDKVWYLRGLERDVVVVLARRLCMMVFAPQEEVYNERTLFIVRRGLCIRKGRMLFNGDVWGEDMILSNPVLREQVRVLSVCYLEVVMLQYVDLDEALQDFPEDRKRLRTAQIKIALRHGIVLIAKTLEDLEYRRGDALELTEAQWNLFFKQVLDGTFSGEIDEPEEEDLVEQEIEHIMEWAEEELAGASIGLPVALAHSRGHSLVRAPPGSATGSWTHKNPPDSPTARSHSHQHPEHHHDQNHGLCDDAADYCVAQPEEEHPGEEHQPGSRCTSREASDEEEMSNLCSMGRPAGQRRSALWMTREGSAMSSELALLRDAICDLQLKVDCLLLRDHPRHHGHHGPGHHAPGHHALHGHHAAPLPSVSSCGTDSPTHASNSGRDRGPNTLRSFMSRRVQSTPDWPRTFHAPGDARHCDKGAVTPRSNGSVVFIGKSRSIKASDEAPEDW